MPCMLQIPCVVWNLLVRSSAVSAKGMCGWSHSTGQKSRLEFMELLASCASFVVMEQCSLYWLPADILRSRVGR